MQGRQNAWGRGGGGGRCGQRRQRRAVAAGGLRARRGVEERGFSQGHPRGMMSRSNGHTVGRAVGEKVGGGGGDTAF